ncbi:MAG: nuclear transport factor 2 family protein [Polyangiaceae bacterium]|nr:nuclear transport factor 2 family protein [Myxococcales bacterium]MCB9586682.1 nuclear transport factor 2 family protein [Polyangiaceae bacterium]MCB9606189.1 nuclear transport factor 2 family protein [Polyangiaceae bacterium]
MENAALELARELTRRTLAGDVDGVGALYHDDAVVWRNFDQRELVKKQVLKVIGLLAKSVEGLRYEELRLTATESGFVQQHVMRGRAPNGAELQVPACLVAQVEDGRIRRLDEYLDAAALAPLMG